MKEIGIRITCLFTIEVDDNTSKEQIDKKINEMVNDLIDTNKFSNCINDIEWSELV